jgi:hypothetical protein
MTVSAAIPCAEMLIQFVNKVTGDHLSNPDPEVRSSKRVHNATLYHLSRPNCQIRICHCCAHHNTISKILIFFFFLILRGIIGSMLHGYINLYKIQSLGKILM